MHTQPISSIASTVTDSTGGRSSTAHQSSSGRSRRVSSGNVSGQGNPSADASYSSQNGSVSVLEEYLYALMHPGAATYLKLLTQYNSRGDVITRVSWMPRLIDIMV